MADLLRGFAVKRYPRWKTEELSAQEIQSLELAIERAGIALRVGYRFSVFVRSRRGIGPV